MPVNASKTEDGCPLLHPSERFADRLDLYYSESNAIRPFSSDTRKIRKKMLFTGVLFGIMSFDTVSEL
jgi:hypothetical protein